MSDNIKEMQDDIKTQGVEEFIDSYINDQDVIEVLKPIVVAAFVKANHWDALKFYIDDKLERTTNTTAGGADQRFAYASVYDEMTKMENPGGEF